MAFKLTLYKLPIHLNSVDRWFPVDQTIDNVLNEYTPTKTFVDKKDVLLTKTGTTSLSMRLKNEKDYLDFNYIVLEDANITYFGKTKIYMFLSNLGSILKTNTDRTNFELELDVLSMWGNDFLINLQGKNVNVKRGHLDRWELATNKEKTTKWITYKNTDLQPTGNTDISGVVLTDEINGLEYLGREYGKTLTISELIKYAYSKYPEWKLEQSSINLSKSSQFINIQSKILIKGDADRLDQSHIDFHLDYYKYSKELSEVSVLKIAKLQQTPGITDETTFTINIKLYIGVYNFNVTKSNKQLGVHDRLVQYIIDQLDAISSSHNPSGLNAEELATEIKKLNNSTIKYKVNHIDYNVFYRYQTVKYSASNQSIYIQVDVQEYLENLGFVPQQDRQNPIWHNEEIDVTKRIRDFKNIKNIETYPTIHNITKNGEATLAFKNLSPRDSFCMVVATKVMHNQLKEITTLDQNYYAYAVLPSSVLNDITNKGKTAKTFLEEPFVYLPINDGDKTKVIPNELANNLFTAHDENTLESQMYEFNSMENLLNLFGKQMSNVIITTTPLINIQPVMVGGRVDLRKTFFKKWDLPEKKDGDTTLQKRIQVFSLRHSIQPLSNIQTFSIKEYLSIKKTDKLPAHVDDDEYLDKDIEVALLGNSYRNFLLEDLLQTEGKQIDSFDVVNGRIMGVTERFTENGPEYIFKIKDAIDFISYENDITIPFGIHTTAEFYRTNADQIAAKKNAIEKQQSQGNFGILSSLLSSAGLAGLGAGFLGFKRGGTTSSFGPSVNTAGLTPGGTLYTPPGIGKVLGYGLGGAVGGVGHGAGSAITSYTSGQTSADIGKEALNAEIAQQSSNVHEYKDPVKNLTNLSPPLEGTLRNGDYGYDWKPHSVHEYYLPKYIKQRIASYFNNYGYSEEIITKLNANTLQNRYLFNYVQLDNFSEHLNESNIPTPILAILEEMFSIGIRLWHCRKDMKTHYPTKKFGSVDKTFANYETFFVENGMIKK